jgi:hypothetical protein
MILRSTAPNCVEMLLRWAPLSRTTCSLQIAITRVCCCCLLLLHRYELSPCCVSKRKPAFGILKHGKPNTRNPKPETRNPKPETRNPKPETRNPKPETRNPKQLDIRLNGKLKSGNSHVLCDVRAVQTE